MATIVDCQLTDAFLCGLVPMAVYFLAHALHFGWKLNVYTTCKSAPRPTFLLHFALKER